MTIAVTAATGHLGRLVVEALLRTVPASELVAVVRDADKAADLAARGVAVRVADYNDSASLEAAFDGVDRLLLISGTDVGSRARQHAVVIDAAAKMGVSLLAYTSVLRASEESLNPVAAEHVATEAHLRASGVPFVLLRNGWYLENYTAQIAGALQHGFAGSAGEGKIAAAARADFAAAAVAALTLPGQAGKVYELAGDVPFTMAQLAAEVAKQSGKPVAYANLPPEAFKGVLLSVGLPGPFADILVDADVNIVKGELDDQSGELRKLIGRPTTTLAAAVAAALPR